MTIQELNLPIDAVRALCRRYQVQELALFGSALSGKFRPESDIDMLVEFQPEAEVGFITLSRMQRELAELLQRPVDLVPKGGLKPRVRQAILDSRQVLYAA
ncbi:MAG: nucleotidyltransferase [Chloroflexi bacterium]|nr:nucleotidyltransferase [Chloroflexota bacterium]